MSGSDIEAGHFFPPVLHFVKESRTHSPLSHLSPALLSLVRPPTTPKHQTLYFSTGTRHTHKQYNGLFLTLPWRLPQHPAPAHSCSLSSWSPLLEQLSHMITTQARLLWSRAVRVDLWGDPLISYLHQYPGEAEKERAINLCEGARWCRPNTSHQQLD